MGQVLATLTDFKNYNNISSTEKDSQLQIMLEYASDYIKRYCNTSFVDNYTTQKVEIFNAHTKDVFLSEVPVNQVVSVKTSLDGGLTQTTLVNLTDFYIDSQLGIITSIRDNFLPKSSLVGIGLEVTYTAGYLIAPSEIAQATIELATYYKDREFVIQKSISGTGLQNAPSIKDALPGHITNLLNLYKI